MSAELALSTPSNAGWPVPAQTDDGNNWVTGRCWLYCRREDVRVLWIGPVKSPGAEGDMYACGPCIAELDHMVRAELHRKDVRTPPAEPAPINIPAHTPQQRALPVGGSGRHRMPRRKDPRPLLPARKTP